MLLVHGFGQTWYEWHQLMPMLAKDHTVIAVELPGLALSDRPKTSFAGQDIAEYLYGFAKKFSPDAKFDVVAHDIGIWNTYPMLVLHQADIGRVVYMESADGIQVAFRSLSEWTDRNIPICLHAMTRSSIG